MMTLERFVIPILFLTQTFYCWWCFFKAKELPYDANYGIIIQAVIISLCAWVLLRVVKAKWQAQLHVSPTLLWIWFVLGSPLTFILGFIFYGEFFGSLSV